MKNLIMVDIQREYSKVNGSYCIDKRYIRNICTYIKQRKFDRVLYILDCNSGEINIPDDFQPLVDEYFYKNYASYDLTEIEKQVELGEMFVVEDGVSYKDSRGVLFIATDNCHETQMVDTDLNRLISIVKHDDNVLIGGCDGECLQDIEKVLDYFDVKYTRNDSLIYPLYTPVIYSYDTINWVNIDCPY